MIAKARTRVKFRAQWTRITIFICDRATRVYSLAGRPTVTGLTAALS
jgi:hypothetical protein